MGKVLEIGVEEEMHLRGETQIEPPMQNFFTLEQRVSPHAMSGNGRWCSCIATIQNRQS